jgi:hypothetical protein
MHLNRTEYVRRLLRLGQRYGEIPIYGSDEWEALGSTDPRKFASVVRAAECWRRDGEPEAIHQHIADHIDHNNRFTAWRLRAASHDVSQAYIESRGGA